MKSLVFVVCYSANTVQRNNYWPTLFGSLSSPDHCPSSPRLGSRQRWSFVQVSGNRDKIVRD